MTRRLTLCVLCSLACLGCGLGVRASSAVARDGTAASISQRALDFIGPAEIFGNRLLVLTGVAYDDLRTLDQEDHEYVFRFGFGVARALERTPRIDAYLYYAFEPDLIERPEPQPTVSTLELGLSLTVEQLDHDIFLRGYTVGLGLVRLWGDEVGLPDASPATHGVVLSVSGQIAMSFDALYDRVGRKH